MWSSLTRLTMLVAAASLQYGHAQLPKPAQSDLGCDGKALDDGNTSKRFIWKQAFHSRRNIDICNSFSRNKCLYRNNLWNIYCRPKGQTFIPISVDTFLQLEVNKCAFTFSSEIRPIQCTRTEFWCVQCPRPAGPSALDKHQIQASALDLSYFTSKSKCKFINLIHTWQKNKMICSCSWKIINKMALKCQ